MLGTKLTSELELPSGEKNVVRTFDSVKHSGWLADAESNSEESTILNIYDVLSKIQTEQLDDFIGVAYTLFEASEEPDRTLICLYQPSIPEDSFQEGILLIDGDVGQELGLLVKAYDPKSQACIVSNNLDPEDYMGKLAELERVVKGAYEKMQG